MEIPWRKEDLEQVLLSEQKGHINLALLPFLSSSHTEHGIDF
jgi:hypothetical protein